MYQDRRCRTATADLGLILVALPIIALAVCIIALVSCGSADPVPVWEPDYPADLDHVRETVGSVFLPTYLPDGYRLQGASPNDNPILNRRPGQTFEASLGYANSFAGIGGELDGFFYISQYPEGWDGDSHIPPFEELTIEGLTVRRVVDLHQDLPEFPAFWFQVDGRWLWISVQEGLEADVDRDELARIARSVEQFSDPVDWLAITGVTERDHYENPIVALESIVERKGEVYVPTYLPSGLGLHSVWLSEQTGDVWLKFESSGDLEDRTQMSALLTTLNGRSSFLYDHQEEIDLGGSTGYVSWGAAGALSGVTSTEVRLEFEREGRWFALEVPGPARAVLDEVIRIALSLSPYQQS